MLSDDGAARAYEADGLPVRSTSQTEELDMQVMLDDGCFHREMDHTESACEKPIPLGQWRRPQQYKGELCKDGCYSPAELARAAKANAAELVRVTEERHQSGVYETELERDRKSGEWPTILDPHKPPRRR